MHHGTVRLPREMIGGLERLRLLCRYVDGSPKETARLVQPYEKLLRMRPFGPASLKLAHERKSWRSALAMSCYALACLHAEYAALIHVLQAVESPPTRIVELGNKAGAAAWATAALWPSTSYIGISRKPAETLTSEIIARGTRSRQLESVSRGRGHDETTQFAMDLSRSHDDPESMSNHKTVLSLMRRIARFDELAYLKKSTNSAHVKFDAPPTPLPNASFHIADWTGDISFLRKRNPRSSQNQSSVALYAFNTGVTRMESPSQIFSALQSTGADTIVILERTTAAGAKFLQSARKWFLDRGYSIVAPCTHSGECPMQRIPEPLAYGDLDPRSPRGGAELGKTSHDGTPILGNVCYFEQGVEVPAFVRSLRGDSRSQHETISFGYLIFSRQESRASESAEQSNASTGEDLGHNTHARVIGRPYIGTGRELRLVNLCDHDATLKQIGVRRQDMRELRLESGDLVTDASLVHRND